MKNRPILFSAPMVRALLDGSKTQTRRVLDPQPELFNLNDGTPCRVGCMQVEGDAENRVWLGSERAGVLTSQRIRFAKGDRLYVREEYYQRGRWVPVVGAETKKGRQKWAFTPADDVILFDPPAEHRKGRHHADPDTVAWHKRLGRFMPRARSRLTLAVTEVRVERLQDCSEPDAKAEGVDMVARRNYRDGYAVLWNSINGPGAWEANPWVVAVTFTVEQRNIDQ